DGRIVQVGPPLEVYRNPADTFVAGFLASPPMNLLDARLGGQTGLDAVELPPVGLPLLEDHKRALAGRAGETITLGIRPEDLDAEPSGAEQGAMTVTVVAVEALGPEVILVGALPGGQEVSARLESDFAAPPGSEVRLHVDLDRLNFFDVDTGRAVTAG
ncbi:MAG: TOBE domain-containing protein, partial [Rhodospirillaceae bacterium]|nr:TOBE domain-containing protein [Rhodospirillaceae bacterium]